MRERSRPLLGNDRADTVGDQVERFLDGAGTDVRYRLADDEKAIDVVLRASRDALAEAGVTPGDVDLVLYTGVARGWMEPAMATVIQAVCWSPSVRMNGLRRSTAGTLLTMLDRIATTALRAGTLSK